MDLNLILTFVGILIGVTVVLLGIWVVGRTSGKLRRTVIFLIITTVIIIAGGFLRLTGFVAVENLESADQIVNVAVVFFILIALLNMKQMINGIDNHYKKKKV